MKINVSAKVLTDDSNALAPIMPSYAHHGDAGMDARAWMPDKFMSSSSINTYVNADGKRTASIEPFERMMLHTGICMQLPMGYECQVRPKSGLALKHGITVLNTPGTVDAPYIGEVCVILINHSDRPFLVTEGMKIGQFVFNEIVEAEFTVVDELVDTTRGAGGFGSTGK